MYLNQILTLSLQNNILLSNQILLLSQIVSSNAKSRIFLQKKTNRNNSNDFLLNYNLVSNSNNPNIEIKRGDNTLENKFDIVTNRINEENSNISKMNISIISENENTFLSGNYKNYNSSLNKNDNIFKNKEFNENLFIKQLENNNFLNINDISKPNFNEKSDTSLLNLEENSNEIKVLKNHKAVYVNNYLLNTPTTSKKLKKLNKIAFIGRSKRGSRFRGVSKNGNQFQVLIMQNKGKSYIGSYNSEEYAARVYDILAIKYRGIKARTNFIYSSQQIKKIYEMDIDVKSKNIYDIIDELI